ncbi:MAG: radical SAM protein, partial [Nanoarchaeota archaeon]
VHNINLKYSEERLFESKELPKPFKKGWSIVVKIICDGRLKNEKLAVSCGRVISIPNCHKEKGDIKVKIVRDKHNIFVGVLK